jgi:hypothetical protein
MQRKNEQNVLKMLYLQSFKNETKYTYWKKIQKMRIAGN